MAEFYTRGEAARVLGITPRTLLRWLEDADIKSNSTMFTGDNRSRPITIEQIEKLASIHKRNLHAPEEWTRLQAQLTRRDNQLDSLQSSIESLTRDLRVIQRALKLPLINLN